MPDILKILLVNDNENDRALAARELSRNFPDSEFHHVIHASQLAHALESSTWDLIVTDYQLRWSEGLSVLAAVKACSPDYPVIMFTGSGSEEIALQAMKAGLDDYVLKSPRHYTRLAAAAHMALQRARQRKALHEAERLRVGKTSPRPGTPPCHRSKCGAWKTVRADGPARRWQGISHRVGCRQS